MAVTTWEAAVEVRRENVTGELPLALRRVATSWLFNYHANAAYQLHTTTLQ
jgi:hypothetical protein